MIEIIKKPTYCNDSGRRDEPAVGRCSCGREVFLEFFTNSCECGLEYNSSGQQLASREQWGEETGEHPLDCV